MKIAIAPHDLAMGGSQMNAVELGAALRDRGHDVIVFGRPGSLCAHIDALGLRFVEAPDYRSRPSPTLTEAFRRLVARERLDVVHAYEWTPGFEAFLGTTVAPRCGVLCSVMSMSVAPFLPRTLPLVVGTEEIGDSVRSQRVAPVWVVEPPVDTVDNHPAFDPDSFRREHGIDADRPLVVVVSRLANELKLEGLEHAIRAMEILAPEFGASLAIVGDGPARDHLEVLAGSVNERLGRRAVTLTGELLDPRGAYAAADVTLGMGSSALRAMAFARPLVVLGENGFCEVFDAESARQFLWQGFYGLGDIGDHDDVVARLAAIVGDLIADPERRAALGRFGRDFVVDRFDLHRQAAQLDAIYQQVAAWRPGPLRLTADVARSSAGVFRYKVQHKLAARRGDAARDDMNAKAVIAARRRADAST